mgnify:CR=1 FL=1
MRDWRGTTATATSDPRYGKGEYTLPSGPVDSEEEQVQLTAWLDVFLQKPNVQLPRPPAVALEVMALSRKPQVRIEDIASVLEREPLLAGRVLKLSNSALYGGVTACHTLKQSLVRVGLGVVRDVVMETAMQMTVLHAEGVNRTLESIRRHSSAVAWLSRLVARNTAFDAENAFLLGLLHDVGLSVGLVGLAEYLRGRKEPVRLTPARWRAVEAIHERFSGAVLGSWGLPPQLTLVAQQHHTLHVGGRAHPQVAVLLIAEHLADDAGWGVCPVTESSGEVPDEVALVSARETSVRDYTDEALRALSLNRRHYQALGVEAQRVLETLSAQYQAAR